MEIPSEIKSQDFGDKMDETEENPNEMEDHEETVNPKNGQTSQEKSAKVRNLFSRFTEIRPF